MSFLRTCTICHAAKHQTRKCRMYSFYNDILQDKIDYMSSNVGYPDKNVVYVTERILAVPSCDKNGLKYMVTRLLKKSFHWSISNCKTYPIDHKQPTKPIGKMTKLQLEQLYKKVMQEKIAIYVDIRKQEEQITIANSDESCPICLESIKEKNTCTTTCGHSFCSNCFFQTIQTQLDQRRTSCCPLCRTECISSRY